MSSLLQCTQLISLNRCQGFRINRIRFCRIHTYQVQIEHGAHRISNTCTSLFCVFGFFISRSTGTFDDVVTVSNPRIVASPWELRNGITRCQVLDVVVPGGKMIISTCRHDILSFNITGKEERRIAEIPHVVSAGRIRSLSAEVRCQCADHVIKGTRSSRHLIQ